MVMIFVNLVHLSANGRSLITNVDTNMLHNSQTIYKYEFQIADNVVVKMPLKTEVLKIGGQHGKRGTGHNCASLTKSSYLDTISLGDGALVFHIFKV